MAKIVRLEKGRKQQTADQEPRPCPHKTVTVYTASRIVSCTTCSTCLDPFDVLVDVIRGSLPGIPERDEERALALEIVKRRNKIRKKEDADRE